MLLFVELRFCLQRHYQANALITYMAMCIPVVSLIYILIAGPIASGPYESNNLIIFSGEGFLNNSGNFLSGFFLSYVNAANVYRQLGDDNRNIFTFHKIVTKANICAGAILYIFGL